MAISMFLKMETIQGESIATHHEREIDVLSWSWGLANSGISRAGGGPPHVGKVISQDLGLTKWVDRASPLLFVAMASGHSVGTATLTLQKDVADRPIDFLVITMKNVFVTSQSDGGSGGGDRLTENITLNFSEVDIKYLPVNRDGTVGKPLEVDWDIARNIVR